MTLSRDVHWMCMVIGHIHIHVDDVGLRSYMCVCVFHRNTSQIFHPDKTKNHIRLRTKSRKLFKVFTELAEWQELHRKAPAVWPRGVWI